MRTLMSRSWLTVSCLTALTLAGSAHLSAQETGSIQGAVRNTEGAPIQGAQVYVESLQRGALTNQDGRYVILNVPAGTYTLSAEFIGYGAGRQEGVLVSAGQVSSVNFELRTEALSLSEIVVTGVTEATSRARIPFTVGRVGREDLVVPPKNAISSIEGRMAGVRVMNTPNPGGGVNVMLRTPTSINRSNTPLFVVDGVIMTESSADLSTMDIESVEVVKGAAAASLYGSRAAAGVIQIRTARGSSLPAERTRFTLRTDYGMNDIPRPIATAQYHNLRTNAQGEFLDANGNVVTRANAAVTEFGFQDQPYPGQVFDHVKSLYKPGDFMTNTGSFGYNGENTNWLATVSRLDEQGVAFENDGYTRNDFRLNLDHRVRNDLSLSVSAFHMRSVRDELPDGVIFDFVALAPDVDLTQPDPDGTRYAFQPDEAGIRANPLYQIVTQTRENKRLRTMASSDVRYNPLDWLAFDVNASYDRSDRSAFWWIPKGVKTPDNPTGDPGFARRDAGLTDGLNASVGANVARNFGPLSTRTMVRGIMEREDNEFIRAEGIDMAVGGIPRLDALRNQTIESTDTRIRSSGYFLNTDLNWDDRYILNGLVRRDGSSLFGPEERWATYYRLSGAYRMAQEAWWPFPELNEFKLRYSLGTAGGRPNFADQYEVFSILSGGGVSLATLGNRFLKPEKSTEQEFGIDVVAFQRISLQLTYATQTTRDQLVSVPLPSLFGFSSQWQNAGTIEGNTWEATLETRLIETPNLRWSMSLVADRSRNRIVEYERPCHSVGLGLRCTGERIGTMHMKKLLRSHDDLLEHRGGVHANSVGAWQVNDDGLLVPVGEGNSWTDGVARNLWGTNVVIDGVTYAWGMPQRLFDESGNPINVPVGDANPDFRWGISNNIQWGGLTIFGLIDGQVGGDVYNQTRQRMYQWLRHGDEDQFGKPEERKKPAVYYAGALYNGNDNVDWFVESGAFVKLRELSVRYRLDPTRFAPLAGLQMERIVLSLTGRNLYTWTKFKGYDPEITSGAADVSVLNRNDNHSYPVYRTLTAGIELVF